MAAQGDRGHYGRQRADERSAADVTRLRLHMVAAPVHTLGPYARFGIWVQGCMKNCPGCVTLDARPLYGGYEMDVDTLARLVLRRPDIEGLTISGGEPFLQGDALYRLILKIRCAADIGVILYTGYAYEEIGGQPLAGQCDAIIDGPYLADLDDGRSLRGSANQRLILLTSRYRGLISFGAGRRTTEWIRPYGGGLAQVGVPSRQDAERAQKLRSCFEQGGTDDGGK